MKQNIKTYTYWPEAKKDYERRICALMRLSFKLRPTCNAGEFWTIIYPNGLLEIKVGLEMLDDCQGQTVFNFCERNKHCFNIPQMIA